MRNKLPEIINLGILTLAAETKERDSYSIYHGFWDKASLEEIPEKLKTTIRAGKFMPDSEDKGRLYIVTGGCTGTYDYNFTTEDGRAKFIETVLYFEQQEAESTFRECETQSLGCTTTPYPDGTKVQFFSEEEGQAFIGCVHGYHRGLDKYTVRTIDTSTPKDHTVDFNNMNEYHF